MLNITQIQFLHKSITSYISTTTSIDYHATYLVLDVTSSVKYVFPLLICIIFFWSNFLMFSFLRQKPLNIFLNDFFFFLFVFYAIHILWTIIEQNNKFFSWYAANSGRRRNWTLKNVLWKQQETKISEGYNLINGAKLWYQMMCTLWSHGHASHTQRHHFLESQVNQVWWECDIKITCT
jgi:hypothetical protein